MADAVWIFDVEHSQVLRFSSPDPGQVAYAHVETKCGGRLGAYGLDIEVRDL
jgi:hypothetical protein